MNPETALEHARRDVLRIYAAALQRVEGRAAVRRHLLARPISPPVHLVAIGKAAASMAEGACEVLEVAAGLVITKGGHLSPAIRRDRRLCCLEADHPVPGEATLAAGRELLAFLRDSPAAARFLFLLSGGASSLVEVLPDGVGLEELRELTDWLLASGLSIGAMNAARKRLSLIKGGRLAAHLRGRPATVLLISDVPGDDPAVIGSGLLAPGADVGLPALPPPFAQWLAVAPAVPVQDFAAIEVFLVATLKDAKQAAAQTAQALGYKAVLHEEFLAGDAVAAAQAVTRTLLASEPCVHIWGGETAVVLPARPGRGGRNQHFALAAAQVLAGQPGLALLAAGSDGTDGPTPDAGALVDGGTIARGVEAGLDAAACLARADAGRFLAASGDLIQTGPTGTNVMDLVLGMRWVAQ